PYVYKDRNMNNKKTYALIPAYNEEKTVGGIVKGLLSVGLKVLVVDDGSSDRTSSVALDAGAKVFKHDINKGKGSAIISGVEFLLKNDKFDYLILLDGDGQHDYRCCSRFVEKADKSNKDIIIGNRMHNPKNMPKKRLYTNKITSFLVSKFCGQYVPDCQSGFRLIKRTVLENVIFKAKRYDIECDMILKASRFGFSIGDIPIESIYANQTSNIKSIRDTWNFIRLLFKALFKC
ncbi:glycosyltransferase family 2 protein, partial [bacterium]|nr:glycosyltransferase family 2 protein [bacterium]